jgi:hypothetical protein
VRLELTVNGTELHPGSDVADERLSAAGLGRVSAWRRLMLRLGGDCRYWEARDPRIGCFDGAVEIYPCRHGYLDPDRQWSTGCLIAKRKHRLTIVEFRVIEGVYAASNLFERFIDTANMRLGPPTRSARRRQAWDLPSLAITAELDRERLNATFRIASSVNGNGNGDGNGGDQDHAR